MSAKVEHISSTPIVILRSKDQHVEVHIGVVCHCPKCEATKEHQGIKREQSDEDNIMFAKAAAFKLLRAQDLEVIGVVEDK
jgi:uncharacterized protein (UPF0212 family)